MNSPIDQTLQDALKQHRQGNLAAAMERYMKVLQSDPKHPDALYYVAVVILQDGQIEKGIELAQRALSLSPPPGAPQARLHNLIGQALTRLGKGDEALASFDRAIAAQPNFADAHGNRAHLLSELGRLDEAMVGFDNALLLRQDSPEDWCNRGATLQWLGRSEEALKSYERAISLRPDLAGAHYNRGNILRDLGQTADARGLPYAEPMDAAEAAYNEAIRLVPDFAEAHLGRGLVRLLRGEWKTGFADYEHRTRAGAPTFTPLPDPRWSGLMVAGERLVLVAEQGLGDTIQMCRFAPLLAARGVDVTILAKPSMRALLSALPGVTIASSVEELKQDKRPIRWLPLMSLPHVLGVIPDTVPADVPYLAAAPERVTRWAERLSGDGFRIGINWAAGHGSDRHFVRRNIPLTAFAPLAALPGVRLIALQKGEASSEITHAPFKVEWPGMDFDAGADAFLDTAAVMMNLDLVLSCDTSVAHLAGALGRKTFVALPQIADWRWLLGRADTPWYPTVRLFRQRERGDWPEMMVRIADAARALI